MGEKLFTTGSWAFRLACGFLMSGSVAAATVGLGEYVQEGATTGIGSAASNDLSGVTYNFATDTLFAVVNDPPRMLELTVGGAVLRSVNLSGFEDTEGVVHLGGNHFGVVEERRRNFVTFTLGAGATAVAYGGSTVIPLGTPGTASSSANEGIEGVAFDPALDQVYVVWEKSTGAGAEQEIRRFDLSDAEMDPAAAAGAMVSPFADGVLASLGLSDLAGMHFATTTDTLLILSHEAFEIVELSLDGVKQPGSLDLVGLLQPEGVTVGPSGEIYVVSEPDELAIFVGPSFQVPEPGTVGLALLASGLLLRRRR